MQRIEDTNQRALVCQSTRQDRHAAAIIGPTLIQVARDTDLVHRRFKQSGAWAVYFNCTFLCQLTLLLAVSQKATILRMIKIAGSYPWTASKRIAQFRSFVVLSKFLREFERPHDAA